MRELLDPSYTIICINTCVCGPNLAKISEKKGFLMHYSIPNWNKTLYFGFLVHPMECCNLQQRFVLSCVSHVTKFAVSLE